MAILLITHNGSQETDMMSVNQCKNPLNNCHSNVQSSNVALNAWFELDEIAHSEIYCVLFGYIHYWNYFQSSTSWLLTMNKWNELVEWWIEHFIFSIDYVGCGNRLFSLKILLMFLKRSIYLSKRSDSIAFDLNGDDFWTRALTNFPVHLIAFHEQWTFTIHHFPDIAPIFHEK